MPGLLLDGDEGRAASKNGVALAGSGDGCRFGVDSRRGDPDSLFRRLGREEFARMIGRRLQNRPHSSECALLTVCLLYPRLLFRLRGGVICLSTWWLQLLETDDLV